MELIPVLQTRLTLQFRYSWSCLYVSPFSVSFFYFLKLFYTSINVHIFSPMKFEHCWIYYVSWNFDRILTGFNSFDCLFLSVFSSINIYSEQRSSKYMSHTSPFCLLLIWRHKIYVTSHFPLSLLRLVYKVLYILLYFLWWATVRHRYIGLCL